MADFLAAGVEAAFPAVVAEVRAAEGFLVVEIEADGDRICPVRAIPQLC